MSGSVPVKGPGGPRRTIPKERLALAERLYLTGVSDHLAQQQLSDRFGVSHRQARRYLERIREKFAKLPQPSPEAVRARSEAMLLEAYGLARSAVKYVTFRDGVGPETSSETKPVPAPEVGTMASCAARLADLHGATGTKKIDVTSGGKPLASQSDDELRARLAALEAADDKG